MLAVRLLLAPARFSRRIRVVRDAGGGDGADGLLRAAAGANAVVERLMVAPLFAGRGVGALDERGLEPWRSFAQASGAAFSCALIVTRTHASPRQKMPVGGEAAHVRTDLGNDRPGT